MAMCLASTPKAKSTKGKKVFLVSPSVAPQTIAVLGTRASGFGIELKIAESNPALEEEAEELGEEKLMGALVQYPDVNGEIGDWAGLGAKVKAAGGKMVVASDLLALTMIKPPGEWGADIVCGNSQRFGKLPDCPYTGHPVSVRNATDMLDFRCTSRLWGSSRCLLRMYGRDEAEDAWTASRVEQGCSGRTCVPSSTAK